MIHWISNVVYFSSVILPERNEVKSVSVIKYNKDSNSSGRVFGSLYYSRWLCFWLSGVPSPLIRVRTTQFSVIVKTKRRLSITKSMPNQLTVVVLVYRISVLISKLDRQLLCWRPRLSRRRKIKIPRGIVSVSCKQVLAMETWNILKS